MNTPVEKPSVQGSLIAHVHLYNDTNCLALCHATAELRPNSHFSPHEHRVLLTPAYMAQHGWGLVVTLLCRWSGRQAPTLTGLLLHLPKSLRPCLSLPLLHHPTLTAV